MDQAAQSPEVAFAGGVQDRTRAEKKQALHERVIEAVIQSGNQRQRSERIHSHAMKYDGKTDAGKDDADVLDRGPREQPLHVGLGSGKHHTVERTEEPECK